MKKLLLTCAVFVLSISSTFAYQQTIYAGPDYPNQYNGMYLNINGFLNYVKFSSSFVNAGSNAYGIAHAYGVLLGSYSSYLIADYHYDGTNSNSGSYSTTVYNKSWVGIQVYMSATNTNGQVKLEWN